MDGKRDREDGSRLTDSLIAVLFANIRWLGPTLLALAMALGGTMVLAGFAWISHKAELNAHEDVYDRRINAQEERFRAEMKELEDRSAREQARMWDYLQTLEAEGRTMGSAWQERIKRDILKELREQQKGE